jgi:hypothetical protein
MMPRVRLHHRSLRRPASRLPTGRPATEATPLGPAQVGAARPVPYAPSGGGAATDTPIGHTAHMPEHTPGELAELFGVGRSSVYRAVVRASARTETTAPRPGTGAETRPARGRR